MADAAKKRMEEAEVAGHFADVSDEVMRTKRPVVVERDGRATVIISPAEVQPEAVGEELTPGQRLAAIIGFGGEDAEEFAKVMEEVLEERHKRMPREVPEFDL